MKQPVVAIQHLEHALQLAETVGDEAQKGTYLMNIGIAHYQNGDFWKANDCLQKAEYIFSERFDRVSTAHVWHNYSLIELGKKNFPEAQRFLNNSFNAYRNLKNVDGIVKVLLT